MASLDRITPTKPLRIIVVQGHRNTSGGNPDEQARTPAIANAITAALVTAGHAAVCLQNDDGTNDNWFNGSLDAVARRVMQYHHQRPVDLMLDVHIESDPANTPGVFSIVPDGDGLRTVTPYAGSDSLASNTLDRAYGLAIARGIRDSTGLALRTRTVREPGLMSERQTHVGGDLGWRLAMFGYTAPAKERMARIVLEAGNLYADRAIITGSNFADKVATGVVAGITELLAGSVAPRFPPFGTVGELRESRRVRVTVDWLRVRKYAETTQPIITELPRGHVFEATGWIIGEAVEGNPVWWLTGRGTADDPRHRLWSGGTDLSGAAVLNLARA